MKKMSNSFKCILKWRGGYHIQDIEVSCSPKICPPWLHARVAYGTIRYVDDGHITRKRGSWVWTGNAPPAMQVGRNCVRTLGCDNMGTTGHVMGRETAGNGTGDGMVHAQDENEKPYDPTTGLFAVGIETKNGNGRERNIKQFPVPIEITFFFPSRSEPRVPLDCSPCIPLNHKNLHAIGTPFSSSPIKCSNIQLF